MKKLIYLILLLPFCLNAQQVEITNTSFTVNAGGSTQGGTPPFYSPADLTINLGDTVKFKNVSGTHNVDGRTTTFPANPASFFSGLPASGAWTFTKVFTVAGFYQFKCSQNGHAATQHGTITVVDNTQAVDHASHTKIMLHPNPANEEVYFMIPYAPRDGKIVITDLSGRIMLEKTTDGSPLYWFDVSTWANGFYFVQLFKENGDVITSNKFSKF